MIQHNRESAKEGSTKKRKKKNWKKKDYYYYYYYLPKLYRVWGIHFSTGENLLWIVIVK
jgi:hypothetical protein